jgi:hypothetical protein
VLYSFGRFFISYYRVNDVIFLGLREAQLFAVAGIVLAPIGPYELVRRAKKRGWRQADQDCVADRMVSICRVLGPARPAGSAPPLGCRIWPGDQGK